MFNLPSQTKEDIKNTIEFLKKNSGKITHVSYYSLILEENTKLFNEKHINMSEDIESEVYNFIIKELGDLGYHQYEISNFAKSNYESLHNIKYWDSNEYIGIGLGAASYINSVRFTNTRSINKYYSSVIKKNNDKIVESQKTTKRDVLEEKIFLGLRLLKGIDYSVIEKNKLKTNDKYYNIKNNKINIKKEYLFLSNTLILNLLEQIDLIEDENLY